MGLFGISKELQFGVCNRGESHASPPTAREEVFIKEKIKLELGVAMVNKKSMAFHWLSPLPGKKRSLSSSCWALQWSQGVRTPPFGLPTLLNYFLFINFFLNNILC